MDEEATRIAFVDFEASSLDSGSFPTELGWAFINIVDRRIRSGDWLIRPEPSWARPASAWSAASERLTGITRAVLDHEGIRSVEALERLLQAVRDRQLLSDERMGPVLAGTTRRGGWNQRRYKAQKCKHDHQ
jgi:hypothetical protein